MLENIILTLVTVGLGWCFAPFFRGAYFGFLWEEIFPGVDPEEIDFIYGLSDWIKYNCNPTHYFIVTIISFIACTFIFYNIVWWLFK